MRISLLAFLATLIFFTSFLALRKESDQPNVSKKIEIRGIYGSPNAFWEKNLRLSELGVNAIFIHHRSISETMMKLAKADGVKVFAEFATLNGKNYVEQHTEAWAVDNSGQKVKPATWFMGVCPTEPGYAPIASRAPRHPCGSPASPM